MIPKIIHRTSNTRTWEEMHVIARSKRMMPDFQHQFWSDEDNLGLVKKVLPHHVGDYETIERGVVRADIARCLYLYVKGGIYCDTDYLFYKALDERFLSHRCVLGVEQEQQVEVGGGYKVGNAFMASEAGLPMWREFVESIFVRWRDGKRCTKEESTHNQEMDVLYLSGPHALSKFLKQNETYEGLVTFMPATTIYPRLSMHGLSSVRDSTTIGAHLCWGRWRNMPLIESVKQRIRRLGSSVM